MIAVSRRRLILPTYELKTIARKSGLTSFWGYENLGNVGQDAYGTNHLTDGGVTVVGGVRGNAVMANGSNVLSIASNESLQIGDGDFWVSAWLYKVSNASFCGPLGKTGTDGTSAAQVEWQMYLNAGIVRFTLSSGSAQTVVSGGGSGVNAWAHSFSWFNRSESVSCTIRQSVFDAFYARGEATSAIAFVPVSGDKPFSICKAGDASGVFNGRVGQVAIGKLPAGRLGVNRNGSLAWEISDYFFNGGAGVKRIR